jgi:hypothetical protein
MAPAVALESGVGEIAQDSIDEILTGKLCTW